MSESYDAVLLDAGNTIVFLDEVAVARQWERAGLAVDAARVREAHAEARRRVDAGLAAGESLDHATWDAPLLDALGIEDEAQRSACHAALHDLHDRHLLFRRVPLGVRAALHALRDEGLSLAVVSNSEGIVEELLRRCGLAPLFDAIVDSAVVGVAKPDPAIFHLALERLGVEPARAVHVGDLVSSDVDGARAAGIAPILVDEDGTASPGLDVPRIASVAELPAHLARARAGASLEVDRDGG